MEPDLPMAETWTAERWRALQEAFQRGLETDPEQRASVLDAACHGDVGLRAEAERMIAAALDDTPAGARDHGAFTRFADHRVVGADAEIPLPAGLVIGRYTIVGVLGRGGMGVVYSAVQAEPRRRVALKLVRPGASTPQGIARLRHEARVLARLQHPGIAQVYEAGSFETSLGEQPWFAMELVDGDPLLEHCAQRGLARDERIALFLDVCAAIVHAHQRGVIHRDLKPANVLVDSAGRPRIVDFGVARGGAADAANTLASRAGELLGTLAYMSPEQIDGDPLEIDTRADVYALGVLLYELLTGTRPHEIEGASTFEAIRRVRDEVPIRLSARDPALAGDLETVVHKALQKDKDARYASVLQFAADLGRWARDEPVLARAPSTLYRLRKYVRRHRAIVAALGVAAAALVVGSGVAVREAIDAKAGLVRAQAAETKERDAHAAAREALVRSDRDREKAEGEARRVIETNQFLGELLLAAAPERQGRDVTVFEMLRQAEAKLADSFGSDPRVRASLHGTIGRAFASLSRYPEAERSWARAVESWREVGGEEGLEILGALEGWAESLHGLVRLDEARELYEHTLAARERLQGPRHPATLEARLLLAGVIDHAGQEDRAFELFSQLYGEIRQALGEGHALARQCGNALSHHLTRNRCYAEAETILRALLDSDGRATPAEELGAFTHAHTLAHVLLARGEAAYAEGWFRHSLTGFERLLGPDDPSVLLVAGSVGSALRKLGRPGEALEHLRRASEGLAATSGPEHPETLTAMNNLAGCLLELDDPREAADWAGRALAARRRLYGEEHPLTKSARRTLEGSLARIEDP